MYKRLDPNVKTIISRNVIFNELSFPFAKDTSGDVSLTSDNADASVSTPQVTIPCIYSRNTEALTQQNPPTTSSEHLTPAPSSTTEIKPYPSAEQPAEPPIIPVSTHSMQTRAKFGIVNQSSS